MLQVGTLPAGAKVRDLVRFARDLYRSPMPADAIMGHVGLEPILERTVDALLGGEAQRVRFAMAIAGDPELVFLDEPTVGMEVESRRAFWGTMRGFAADGRTILFATHYLEEADQAADRIVVSTGAASAPTAPPHPSRRPSAAASSSSDRTMPIRVGAERDQAFAEVLDDGVGEHHEVPGRPGEAGTRSDGSGLAGLARRVAGQGGVVMAGALPDRGYQLRVSVPLGEAPIS